MPCKVEKDPLNYRDTDAADARLHAQEIFTELGNAPHGPARWG